MIYPPLTLEINVELDEHTREFFDLDPKYQSAPAQAVVELRTLQGRFFVARLAPLRLNWNLQVPRSCGRLLGATEYLREEITWVPVLREIHYEAPGSGTLGRWLVGNACLVSFHDMCPRLPRGEVLSRHQIKKFWRDNIAVVTKASTGSVYQVFLAESITLAHCYSHQPSGLGLVMFALGDCGLANLQESSQDMGEDVHEIQVGCGWMDEGDPNDEDGVRHCETDLADLSNTKFQAKVEALLRQPPSELGYAMEFYQADQEERCRQVFKCSTRTWRLAQKKCEVEVLKAMRKGGELYGCIWVRCTPWGDKEFRVVAANDNRVGIVKAPALQQRLAAICSQLGATPSVPAPTTKVLPESLWHKVRYKWATRLYFQIQAESALKIAVRIKMVNAEIEDLEAETATRTA